MTVVSTIRDTTTAAAAMQDSLRRRLQGGAGAPPGTATKGGDRVMGRGNGNGGGMGRAQVAAAAKDAAATVPAPPPATTKVAAPPRGSGGGAAAAGAPMPAPAAAAKGGAAAAGGAGRGGGAGAAARGRKGGVAAGPMGGMVLLNQAQMEARTRERQERLKERLQLAQVQRQRAREEAKKKAAAIAAAGGDKKAAEVANPQGGGATTIMKSNTPGTQEFEQRKKDVVKAIQKVEGPKRAQQVEKVLQNPQGKPPFRVIVSKPKIAEKIPVIKRMIKLGTEEELILDASLAFVNGLRFGVFKHSGGLNDYQKKALGSWFQLLRIALPHEWAVHTLIEDLLDNLDAITKAESALNAILKKHAFPRQLYSRSCAGMKAQHGIGFNCGFWKLLHVMTIGVAEHRGGINLINAEMVPNDSSTRRFAPADAADTLRDYMAYFFPCDLCSGHFVEYYDSCHLKEHCGELAEDPDTTTDDEWKELGVWLWEFHNEVSIRLLHERADLKQKSNGVAGPGAATVMDEIQVLWPPLSQCVTCYNPDGTWNEDAVFLHLEKTYWPMAGLDSKTARLLRFDDELPNDADHAAYTWILIIAAFILGGYLRQVLFSSSGLRQTMLKAQKKLNMALVAPSNVVAAKKQ